MIKSFSHKGLEKFYETSNTKSEKDMDLPGYNLYSLKGNLGDYWSVKVNKIGDLFSALRLKMPSMWIW
jgi:plasmid maintenance system killer protein